MRSKGSRTRRACDGCRVSKVKCSGTVPCEHCLISNIPCVAVLNPNENSQQRSSQRQIQYLLFERARLTRALQQLYKQTLSGEPWHGDPVTELDSDGPSIHEILQRLETDSLAESGMGTIAIKTEQNPASSWPQSQERRMSDIEFSRGTDIFAKDAGSKGTLIPPKVIEVAMPTSIDTAVVEAPARPFNRSSAAFSTTSPLSTRTCESFEFLQDGASTTCAADPDWNAYPPPWMLYTQSIDNFAPIELNKF